MKSFHKACHGTELSEIKITKGKRTIIFDKCEHCDRIIESYEIDRNRICLNKAVSNVEFSSPYSLRLPADNIARRIVQLCD